MTELSAGAAIVAGLSAANALPPDWEKAFAAVDRTLFVPNRVWPFDHATGTYGHAVDRTRDPKTWHAAAAGPNPLVTQWDDGAHTGDAPGTLATSSASAPAAVADLLGDLDAAPGTRVLDVGTGTGYTAALLAAHGCTVTTIEIDPDLADRARTNLARAGHADHVTVITGDATDGHPPTGPFDRVHVTAGVRRIPAAWIRQTRPGGVIVMPWGTDYSPHDWALRLTVTGPDHATGPFTRALSFMKLRDQREHTTSAFTDNSWMDHARTSTPSVDLADVTGGAYDPVEVVIGLHVPHCVPQLDGRTLWLDAPDTGAGPSIAAAWFPDTDQTPTAYQFGPRDQWGEVEDAWHHWNKAGRPGPTEFGLTATATTHDVTQTPWHRTPDNELAIRR
ncbi:methyltransferase domain-containing protein [Embleya sp. AB8]|uniref:methyltransferase domain-containing protein n=1 Tax=Embleya sp. AB8 TaxID=3156304 RepID=UPI003C768F4D